MSEERRTPIYLTFMALGFLGSMSLLDKPSNEIHTSSNEEVQDPEQGKKKAIAEGYGLRDRLYTNVDKDKNRILDVKERRSLLDLLGFEKTFLNDTDTLSVRPTKEGDGRLNVYLSQGFDGYVGTVPYSQVEVVLDKKK